jgi:hypothetical protein
MSEATARLEEARWWYETHIRPWRADDLDMDDIAQARLADLERAAAIPQTSDNVPDAALIPVKFITRLSNLRDHASTCALMDGKYFASALDVILVWAEGTTFPSLALKNSKPAIPVSETGAHLFECQCLDCLAGLSVKEKSSRTQSSPKSGERA